MDFGTLKNTFTQILIESHINGDNKGKNLYKKFLKTIKENETLRDHFIVYKNIEGQTSKSEVEANEYIKENLSLLTKYIDVRGTKKTTISEENQKLIKLLKNNGYNIVKKPSELHESLHKLTTIKKDVLTINEIHESFEKVKNWLTTPKQVLESVQKPTVDANKFLDIAVGKYNEKYSTISEEEKRIVKTILSENVKEKKSLLNEMVTESIELINKSIKDYGNNIDVKVRLLEAKDVIRDLKFNNETFKEDILKIYDLKNNLN